MSGQDRRNKLVSDLHTWSFPVVQQFSPPNRALAGLLLSRSSIWEPVESVIYAELARVSTKSSVILA